MLLEEIYSTLEEIKEYKGAELVSALNFNKVTSVIESEVPQEGVNLLEFRNKDVGILIQLKLDRKNYLKFYRTFYMNGVPLIIDNPSNSNLVLHKLKEYEGKLPRLDVVLKNRKVIESLYNLEIRDINRLKGYIAFSDSSLPSNYASKIKNTKAIDIIKELTVLTADGDLNKYFNRVFNIYSVFKVILERELNEINTIKTLQDIYKLTAKSVLKKEQLYILDVANTVGIDKVVNILNLLNNDNKDRSDIN